MSFVEHLDAYFADFGIDAVVDGVNVIGIFDDDYIDPLGIAGNSPVLVVPSSVNASIGDDVIINGITYTVAEKKTESGLVRLILESA